MDLNTILIILGIIALIALVAHGLWANRRERSQYFENANIFTRDSRTQSGFTSSDTSTPKSETAVPAFAQPKPAAPVSAPAPSSSASSAAVTSHAAGVVSPTQQNLNFDHEAAQPAEEAPIEPQSVNHIKITLPDEPPAYQSVEAVVEPAPQPVPDLSKVTIADIEAQADEEEGITTSSEQLRVQLQEAAQNQPVYTDEVNREATQPVEENREQPELENLRIDAQPEAPAEEPAPSFIMLYVVAPENRVFQGTALEQRLDNLGFLLGKDRIYHRHLDLSIASPVLFSVADINAPGTFEAYHLSEFSTVGIVLFMQVPSVGNDRANLKMMIRAAKTLAEQLGGFVLDDKQEIFSEQTEQEYLTRV